MNNKNQWSKRMARGFMALMLAVAPMQGAFAQVTLNTPNTTLGVVIKKIQAQSKFKFFYEDELADMRVKAIDVKNASLEKVLTQLLKDKGVTFKVEDKVVYLKRSEQAPQHKKTNTTKRKITGRILDENGEPLIGASVTIKGTTDRAVTDIDGNYTVMTDAENPVAQFTYLGYKTQEQAADKSGVVNAKMVLDSQSIDEVVVTALGIKREKKMLGYSVQDIKSDALNTTGDPSVTGALEGKVAGLQMNTASTGLGGSTKITSVVTPRSPITTSLCGLLTVCLSPTTRHRRLRHTADTTVAVRRSTSTLRTSSPYRCSKVLTLLRSMVHVPVTV